MLARTITTTLGLILIASPCYAWSGNEHVAIGTNAYHLACARLTASVAKLSTSDERVNERLALVCAAVVPNSGGTASFIYESLAGEWAAIAADHAQTADQLTSVQLGDVVVDYRMLSRVATTNYRHFHPASVTSWRAAHLKSLEAALIAAKATGINAVEAFESSLAEQAFAQHYLQDSFAAGHMGFNRVASSNAGALTYHNTVSKTGRCVADQANNAWYTYGDGYLGKSKKAVEHVLNAAQESMYDFLYAFVFGEADESGWRHTWTKLPAYYNEDITSEQDCVAGHDWPSLRSVSRPAQAVYTYELSLVADYAIRPARPRALMFGISRDAGAFTIGYRTIRARIFGAVGATVKQTGTRPLAYMFDFGEVFQIATTARGTITHEVGFGELYYYRPHNVEWFSYRDLTVRAFYAMNVELGRLYVRTQVGYAFGGPNGPHISTGVGWVRASTK